MFGIIDAISVFFINYVLAVIVIYLKSLIYTAVQKCLDP